MAVLEILLSILTFIWELLKEWLKVFISPLKNLEMLWIIIPIWVNWFFTEVFQEKKGTSLGNAVTNGGIMIWVGVDWIRYMVRTEALEFEAVLISKLALAGFVAVMGFFIVIQGIKAKQFVHFVGRVRETTYVLVMVSPIIYGVVPLSWQVFVAIIVFAPLFYYIIEFAMRITPHPKTYEEKKEEMPELEGLEPLPEELHPEGKHKTKNLNMHNK